MLRANSAKKQNVQKMEVCVQFDVVRRGVGVVFCCFCLVFSIFFVCFCGFWVFVGFFDLNFRVLEVSNFCRKKF